MPQDIFISYSSKDKEKADQLSELLASAGLSVWIDRSGIDVATSWSAEIFDAIESCKAFIVMLSPTSIASKNVTREVALAFEQNKKILPLDLEPVTLTRELGYHLAGIQRTPLTNTTGILRALKKLGLETTSEPPPEKLIEPQFAKKLHLAVLPFEDLSPAKDNGWFADGMMDELINTLGSLEKLHVTPRTDVIVYKDKKPTLPEIASDLGCRYIIEGGVQKSGDKVRIRVSLSDAKERKQLWSEKYDGSFEDIFWLQDKTCLAIAEALKLKLTPEEEKKIETRPTNNPDAYELWLKGKEYYLRATAKGYEHALSLYEKAIGLDPRFVSAYSSIANACLAIYIQYSPTPQLLEKAEAAMKEIFSVEGESSMYFCGLSRIAIRRGNSKEALHFAKQAVELGPRNVLAYDVLGFANQAAGNLPEASKAFGQLVTLQENSISAHFAYIISLHELKDRARLSEAADHAIPKFRRHIHLNPDDYNARVNFATVLLWAGETGKALSEADELSRIGSLDGHGLYNLACLYLSLQHRDRAILLLQKAIDKGYKNIETFRHDPDLDPLRGMEEFEKMVKELGEKTNV